MIKVWRCLSTLISKKSHVRFGSNEPDNSSMIFHMFNFLLLYRKSKQYVKSCNTITGSKIVGSNNLISEQ